MNPGRSIPLTVLAITFNEEDRLPGFLDCVSGWASDVFIVDSGSTDRTVDIALDFGVKIIQRRFDSFTGQWNYAASSLPVSTPWSMKLDPDERLVDDAKAEIGDALADAEDCAGFYIRRRLWFMGRQLHVMTGGSLRIWRTGHVEFSGGTVNERASVSGKCGRIDTPVEHLDSPTLHDWCRKQNRNTTLEADRLHRGGRLAAEPKLFGSALQRRMWFKDKFHRVPGRFALLALYLWLWRGAWRDGRVGCAWVAARVGVMRLREMKAAEMRQIGPYAESAVREGKRVLDSRIAESDLQKMLSPIPPG